MMELKFHTSFKHSSGNFKLEADLEISPGEIIAIYGPSGAGKTTFLRSIAGLIEPDGGFITVNAKTWFNSFQRKHLQPQQRSIGYVFQENNLFPNMTALGNIAFGANQHQKNTAEQLLAQIGLSEKAGVYPNRLSGGQQQRIAIARALIRQPQVLLLDEPFSALDHENQLQVEQTMVELRKSNAPTTLIVTHDLATVFRLADRVIHLNNGKVQAFGTPENVFSTVEAMQGIRQLAHVIACDASTLKVLINRQKITLNQPSFDVVVGDQLLVIATANGWEIHPIQH